MPPVSHGDGAAGPESFPRGPPQGRGRVSTWAEGDCVCERVSKAVKYPPSCFLIQPNTDAIWREKKERKYYLSGDFNLSKYDVDGRQPAECYHAGLV